MTQNITKLFFIVTILGVYAGSMYNLGAVRLNLPQLERVQHSPEDVQKILDVTKVQAVRDDTTRYVPGVACVIQATPEMSINEMQSLFEDCAISHTEHMQSVDFNRQ